MKVGIVGGGLTGLTIASTLKANHEVLEKEKECGGLCRSVVDKGFTFDQGGHILFSRDKEILDWMLDVLGANKHKKRRNNRVLIKGRKVKYPFENDLAGLPFMDNMRCLFYYLFNSYPKSKPRTFRAWLLQTFGKGISELYLLPYNEKIWNFKTEKMSSHWVAGRVPKPPKIDVVKSSLGIKTEGYKHQLYFYYPKNGGIQSIIKALEKRAGKIVNRFEVKELRKKGKKWIVSDGKRKRQYDKIISTMPAPILINCLENVPKKVKDAAKNLKYNSLITVMIGLNIENLTDMTAIYIPTRKVNFHRICFMNNFSEYCAPKGKSALVAEITVNKGDDFYEMSDEELIDHAVSGLDKLKLINKDDVVYSRVIRSKYAYVVYDLEYQRNIKIIRDFIKSRGIILCGRFAEFEYLNMDGCIKRALELTKRLNEDEK